MEAWIARLEMFGGIEEITRASLRGTDGTNMHHYDEKIEGMAANLDPDVAAMIDELMNPTRSDTDV